AITDEYGVASGVRRIEFFAGKYALAYLQTLRQTIAVAAERLKTTPAQLNEKIDQILENNKQQEKRFAELQSRNFLASSDILVAEAQKIGEVALIVKEISGADMPTLRQLLDHIRSKLPCAVVVLYAIDQQALQVVAHVNKFLSESSKMSAVDLVRQLCGKGGGRPDLAQGGGTCPTDLAERLKDISLWVQKNIKI
ncbi:MAG: DHHA1 domain-containing protein, partial [Legionellaceae bacterium]|nr:DHHA1 domain-containing protein [Legionellaceae bacterium]